MSSRNHGAPGKEKEKTEPWTFEKEGRAVDRHSGEGFPRAARSTQTRSGGLGVVDP